MFIDYFVSFHLNWGLLLIKLAYVLRVLSVLNVFRANLLVLLCYFDFRLPWVELSCTVCRLFSFAILFLLCKFTYTIRYFLSLSLAPVIAIVSHCFRIDCCVCVSVGVINLSYFKFIFVWLAQNPRVEKSKILRERNEQNRNDLIWSIDNIEHGFCFILQAAQTLFQCSLLSTLPPSELYISKFIRFSDLE